MKSKSAEAISRVRKLCGMTQVQFAERLGVAKNSIYRYEAGTSIPSIDILWEMVSLALGRHSLEVADEMTVVIKERVEEITGAPFRPLVWGISSLWAENQAAIENLPPNDQLRVMAFVRMLSDGPDEKTNKMLDYLLDPWVAKVARQLDTKPFGMVTNPDFEASDRAEEIRRILRETPNVDLGPKTTPAAIMAFSERVLLFKELAELAKPKETIEAHYRPAKPPKPPSG